MSALLGKFCKQSETWKSHLAVEFPTGKSEVTCDSVDNTIYVEYVNGKSKISNSVVSLSQRVCLLWLFFVAINHLFWHLRTDLKLLMGSLWHLSMAVKWCLTEIRLRRADCSKKWKTKTCNASNYHFTSAPKKCKKLQCNLFYWNNSNAGWAKLVLQQHLLLEQHSMCCSYWHRRNMKKPLAPPNFHSDECSQLTLLGSL